jgi:hypothetical protein
LISTPVEIANKASEGAVIAMVLAPISPQAGLKTVYDARNKTCRTAEKSEQIQTF